MFVRNCNLFANVWELAQIKVTHYRAHFVQTCFCFVRTSCVVFGKLLQPDSDCDVSVFQNNRTVWPPLLLSVPANTFSPPPLPHKWVTARCRVLCCVTFMPLHTVGTCLCQNRTEQKLDLLFVKALRTRDLRYSRKAPQKYTSSTVHSYHINIKLILLYVHMIKTKYLSMEVQF